MCAEQTRSDGYAPRRPEDTLLHALVSEHWPRFRERAEARGGLPKFVVLPSTVFEGEARRLHDGHRLAA
jgi:hypothetical protein